MPTAPLRICLEPACPERVQRGRASNIGGSASSFAARRRVGATTPAWTRLRNSFISQPANVRCAHCKAEGKRLLSAEVDDIQPFNGPDDPLRLDTSNLQALCKDSTAGRQRREAVVADRNQRVFIDRVERDRGSQAPWTR